MKVEIRDITKEEAVPYGDNADIVLAERKAVVFTDDAGNTGKLYMKEEDVELLGEQYIAEIQRWSIARFAKSGFRACRGTHTRTTRHAIRRRPLMSSSFATWMANAQKSGADSTPAATSCGNFATNRSLVG